MSGPKVGGRADLAVVFSAIDQASKAGFVNVVFTGGEPTLYFDDLIAAIAYASTKGLLTRVVTNAGWCKTPERASAKMNRLQEAGLDEINFSAGDEHQRFIPLDHVITAIICALDRDLPVHLMIENTKVRRITKQLVFSQSRLSSHPRLSHLGISESPWMPLDPLVITQYDDRQTANRDNIPYFPGCDSILQTYVLHPGSEVTSCCGIGARVIPELRSDKNFQGSEDGCLDDIIVEAEDDFLKLWLRQEGPEKVLAWAAGHDPEIEWEDMYAHRCQACARIYSDRRVRTVLAERYEEKIADIIAKSYLFEVNTEDSSGWISAALTDSGSKPRSTERVEPDTRSQS